MLNIIVGAAFGVLLGVLWYSPVLFRNAWLAEIGKSKEELGGPVKAMIITCLTAGLESVALQLLIVYLDVIRITGAIKLGLLVGFGFIASSMLADYLYERRSLKLYAINAGYQVSSALLISIALLLMRK